LVGITAGGTVEWEITAVSFTGDGVELTFGTNDSNAIIINYKILSGENLNNIVIGTAQLPSTTGNFSFATGLSFVPIAGLLMSVGIVGSTLPQSSDHASFCYGAFTGANNEWVISCKSSDNVATTSAIRGGYSSNCFHLIRPVSGTTVHATCNLVSINSVGNGITFMPKLKVYYLCMRYLRAEVGMLEIRLTIVLQ
jgi:hypothetical protein